MSAIDELITELARLPGIGRKTAQRLTFHLLQQPPDMVGKLASALVAVAERVRPCAECGNLTEEQPCAICRDPRRDPALGGEVLGIGQAGQARVELGCERVRVSECGRETAADGFGVRAEVRDEPGCAHGGGARRRRHHVRTSGMSSRSAAVAAALGTSRNR